MANINLLPWREWERERKQKEFLGQTATIIVVAIVLVLGFGQYLNTSIEGQEGRNEFLTAKIKDLDQKIAEIRELRRQREDLLARMRVIQELQGNRSVIVRVFDQVVRTLAGGVHYKKLEMEAATLSVAGVAESNNRISALMRNLEASEWFASPNLRSIKEDPQNQDYGEQASTFDLSFVQVNPATEENQEEDL